MTRTARRKELDRQRAEGLLPTECIRCGAKITRHHYYCNECHWSFRND